MPASLRNVAALYLSVSLDLSSTARTFTPRLWASTRALAMGAEVKLYACISTCVLAAVQFTDDRLRGASMREKVHGNMGWGECLRSMPQRCQKAEHDDEGSEATA